MHVFFLVFSYHVLVFLPHSLVDVGSGPMQSVLYLPYRTLLELCYSVTRAIWQTIVTLPIHIYIYILYMYMYIYIYIYIYTEIIFLYIEPNSKIPLAFAIELMPNIYLLIYATLKPYIPTDWQETFVTSTSRSQTFSLFYFTTWTYTWKHSWM